MDEDQIVSIFMFFMMLLFCFHGGLLLYFCSYLRKRGITELSFIQTLITAMTGNIKKFYKVFYIAHSEEHSTSLTKTLIVWHITTVALLFLSPVLLAIYIGF